MDASSRNYKLKSPIYISTFKRPFLVELQLEMLSNFDFDNVYISSDQGRNHDEMELVNQTRKIIDKYCEQNQNVKVYYSSVNIGPSQIEKHMLDAIFKEHDRVIYLEEDCIPNRSFYKFADEMLHKYKNDKSIYLIGGVNSLGEYPLLEEPSYFFTNTATVWGMAFWRRTYKLFDIDLDDFRDGYYRQAVQTAMIRNGKKEELKYLDFKIENPNDITNDNEFFYMGLNPNVLYNAMVIIPNKNLIDYQGNSAESENSDSEELLPKRMRWLSELPSYELEFPLIHPKYKICDYYYRDKVKKAYYIPKILKPYYLFERIFRLIINGKFNRLLYKIKRRIKVK